MYERYQQFVELTDAAVNGLLDTLFVSPSQSTIPDRRRVRQLLVGYAHALETLWDSDSHLVLDDPDNHFEPVDGNPNPTPT